MLEYLLAAIVGVLLLLLYLKTRPVPSYKRPELIPGWTTPPADPEMGDLGVISACGGVSLYLQQQHQGGTRPLFSFWWRKQRVVSVCGPQAFKDTENIYNNPQLIFGVLSKQRGPGIISLNDSAWKERKKLIYGTLRGRNVDSFIHQFVRVARETVTLWSPGQEIAVKKEMFRMAMRGIVNTLFVDIFASPEAMDQMTDVYQSCKHETHRRQFSNTPPDSTEFKHDFKLVTDYLRQMVQSRREQLNSEEDSKEVPFLDAIIQSGLSEEDYMADVLTISSGFETSGAFLTWLLYFLARHPEVQDRLLGEIKEKVREDSDETLKAYVLSSDSYLRQVLDEALRCSNTAPYTPHYCNEDMVVGGYLVPAKTTVLHAMGVTLMDQTIWDNPRLYDPHRFAPGSKHAKRGREFRPFGVSCARRCPANQYSYAMASIYLTVLLQHFSFLSPGQQEVDKFYGVITYPKEEVYLQIRPRK